MNKQISRLALFALLVWRTWRAAALARDLLGTGVSVNCVNPGPIDSPMHAPLTAEQRARVVGSIPLGWMARPEEIANGVLFLASSRAASFMYGTNLNIDGGTQMGTS